MQKYGGRKGSMGWGGKMGDIVLSRANFLFYPRDATRITRSLLSRYGWMAVCNTPVLCLNG